MTDGDGCTYVARAPPYRASLRIIHPSAALIWKRPGRSAVTWAAALRKVAESVTHLDLTSSYTRRHHPGSNAPLRRQNLDSPRASASPCLCFCLLFTLLTARPPPVSPASLLLLPLNCILRLSSPKRPRKPPPTLCASNLTQPHQGSSPSVVYIGRVLGH